MLDGLACMPTHTKNLQVDAHLRMMFLVLVICKFGVCTVFGVAG